MDLSIDLRDGFHHTPVVIRIDGSEVFRADDVTTRRQIGLARQLAFQVTTPSARLEVELPDSGKTVTVRVGGHDRWSVGIELDDQGTPRVREQAEPFGYV